MNGAENTVGEIEFREKHWSYVLDMLKIPVSHLSGAVKQAVGYGFLWHFGERFGGRNEFGDV